MIMDNTIVIDMMILLLNDSEGSNVSIVETKIEAKLREYGSLRLSWDTLMDTPILLTI